MICIFGGLFGALGPCGGAVQPSISHYYHTNMRDVLVGLLGCVAIFFMTYSGYGWLDNLFTWGIGLAGAGVAIFPCPTHPPGATPVGILQLPQVTSGSIHYWCAGAFFFFLAINSIFLFTLSNEKGRLGQSKRSRNAIYIASGVVILASLLTLLILNSAAETFFENTPIALVFETVMLIAFGVSWLVKGDIGLFRD
jgi:magnesium-transporting ATPase (P-type)